MRTYVQEGNVIDVVLAADAKSDDVIVKGKLVGIATTDGLAGQTIACRVEGCIAVAKASASVFAQGVAVSWDDAANVATTGAGALMGYASAPAASGETVVQVKLTPSAA